MKAAIASVAPESPFLAEFKSGGWAKRGPGFIRDIRESSLEPLAKPFPTTRDSAWRHTNLRPIVAGKFAPLLGPARSVNEPEVAPFRIPGTIELLFVDGHFVPGLSHIERLPRGVTIGNLAAAVTKPSEALEGHLARHADNDHPVVALNNAFLQDGSFVHLAPHAVLEEPVHLLHVSTGPVQPAASHMRHLVVAEADSQATVIESYAGLTTGSASLTTTVTEIVAAQGSHVKHVKLQRENLHAFHLSHLAIRQDRDSHVHDLLLSVGAAVARNEVNVVLGSPGAEVHLNGIFLGTGRQQVDCPTFIDHAVPHTTSRELYKGILDGSAHGAFFGMVKVRADAQKTDAQQTNKNLLLSHNALVDTTPQLEIHADDVKCSHGSTIGQISKDALFFLRSRGIREEAARLLLTQAFAHEVLEKGPPELRPLFDGLLTQWFACRKVAGVPLE